MNVINFILQHPHDLLHFIFLKYIILSCVYLVSKLTKNVNHIIMVWFSEVCAICFLFQPPLQQSFNRPKYFCYFTSFKLSKAKYVLVLGLDCKINWINGQICIWPIAFIFLCYITIFFINSRICFYANSIVISYFTVINSISLIYVNLIYYECIYH